MYNCTISLTFVPEHLLEQVRAGGEDDFVRLHRASGVGVGVVTGQSDVEEVRLGAQLSEGAGDVRLKVVPAETEVLRGTHLDVVPLGRRRWQRWQRRRRVVGVLLRVCVRGRRQYQTLKTRKYEGFYCRR